MKARVNQNISKAYLKILLAIALVAAIGFSVVPHYGITWDEPMELDMVQWNLDFIKKGKPISEHGRYHGFIFNYFSDVVYQAQDDIKQKLATENITKEKQQTNWQKWLTSIRQKTAIKHIVTFAFSLLAYFSVAGIVSILADINSAWFGVIILALFPRFWGHSFFNPKDLPFATLFIAATCAGTFVLNTYFKTEEKEAIRLGFNKVTIYSLLYGCLIGLTTGVRIGGFFLLFFLPIAHILAQSDFKSIYKTLIRYSKLYLVIYLTWAITTITIYPASWHNPIIWFWKAVNSLSKFSVWNNYVLFNGQQILGRELPWYYLPRWISITVPVLFQISALVGLIWIISKYRQFTKTQRACAILVILQIFFLPFLAIIRQSTMYDEMRHFIFILPGIAVLASTTIIWVYQKIMNRYIRIFMATLLSLYCVAILYDMISLHPYEFIYFNRNYGGLKAAYHQQETEYWGLSFKEAMEWLNQNAEPNSTILIAGPWIAAEIYADPSRNFTIMNRDEFPWGKVPNPDYYMALPRYDYQSSSFFPECPIIYSVTRQDTPLTTIRNCLK
ncbi:hypothetical protein C7H19_04735 [Aphanothece hegewaldii CCALA 016]|uniref:Glycosyltransferase RgtA/B/C/D-like domain-containing protein n=1 Tax=Aphanothece hegewaldii CCALA 016 TaxID=2107694 RepID=A0A2T1M0W1_9CHRO|nr:hypothetical protein [Aphanothece hegewaldii]PSF38304.1 hypothetical protein C7H19_04735 [Aphanothece hegewaldii CCALA 016]